jgi:CHAD domain-containing protein
MNATKMPSPSRPRTTSRAVPLADFRVLILNSLNDRWHTFRAELKRCQKQYSEAAVHDLRVATRRLISTLDLVRGIHPEANLRKARRALKRQLDMFDPLRDVQVQLLAVDKMLASFPELQGFYNALVMRERKLVRRLSVELKGVKTGKIKKGIAGAAVQLEALRDTPAVQQQRRTEAIRVVEVAFNQVVERKQAIDPSDSASIHRMRVAFKRFRYVVESLVPVLDHVTGKQLRAMNAFQGSMGDIQDAEVLLISVLTFARKSGPEREASLARVLEELSRRRTALIDTFLGAADTLFTFWKPVS